MGEARPGTCPEVSGVTGGRLMVDHNTVLVLKDAAVLLMRLGWATLVCLSSFQPQLSTLGMLWAEESFHCKS